MEAFREGIAKVRNSSVWQMVGRIWKYGRWPMTLVAVYMGYTGATGRHLVWDSAPSIAGDLSRHASDASTSDNGRWLLVLGGVLILLLAWGPTAFSNVRSALAGNERQTIQSRGKERFAVAEIQAERVDPPLTLTSDFPDVEFEVRKTGFSDTDMNPETGEPFGERLIFFKGLRVTNHEQTDRVNLTFHAHQPVKPEFQQGLETIALLPATKMPIDVEPRSSETITLYFRRGYYPPDDHLSGPAFLDVEDHLSGKATRVPTHRRWRPAKDGVWRLIGVDEPHTASAAAVSTDVDHSDAETPMPDREVDALLRGVQAARANVVLRGNRLGVGSGLFGSFTADDLVIAEARNYIGRYGTPADGQRLRDLEGEYRGRRTPEAKIRRLDAVMQVLTDMNKRGTP